MKTLKINSLIVAIALLAAPSLLFAQKGNGNVVTQERQLPAFNSIETGSAINVFLSQGK